MFLNRQHAPVPGFKLTHEIKRSIDLWTHGYALAFLHIVAFTINMYTNFDPNHNVVVMEFHIADNGFDLESACAMLPEELLSKHRFVFDKTKLSPANVYFLISFKGIGFDDTFVCKAFKTDDSFALVKAMKPTMEFMTNIVHKRFSFFP